MRFKLLVLLLAFLLLFSVERQFIFVQVTVFLHLVHKTTYEYNEYSYTLWKKIAQHVHRFVV